LCFTAAGNLPLLVEAAESDILKETEMAEAALQRDVVNDATFDVDMSTSSASESQLRSLSTSAAAAASPRPPSLHQSPPGSATQISFAVDETRRSTPSILRRRIRCGAMTWWRLTTLRQSSNGLCTRERRSAAKTSWSRPRASRTPWANGNWHLCLLFTINCYVVSKN